MPIINWFEPEKLIQQEIADLFPADMVFTEANSVNLNNETFTEIALDRDKVALLILNTGFIPGNMVRKKDQSQQKITQSIKVAVVCPRELYYENGGPKIIKVIHRLNGTHLSPQVIIKKLTGEKQNSNPPEYLNDLVYIPVVFDVDMVI